jgi:ketosteroid isomerase-like protein
MSIRIALSSLAALIFVTGNINAQAGVTQAGRVDIRAEEAAIRAAAKDAAANRAPDAIFWSGAYARPIIGKAGEATAKPRSGERFDQRRNVQRSENIVRLEVAASGDMAYDFTNFTLSYDLADTKEHASFQGSALRVWKKLDGQWRAVAWFARPYDDEK